MEIQVQPARRDGRVIQVEDSQTVKTDKRKTLSQWGEAVAQRFRQPIEKQIFLFNYGRKLEAKPRGDKWPAKQVSFSDLGVKPGEEFLYIVEDGKRSTYRCQVKSDA